VDIATVRTFKNTQTNLHEALSTDYGQQQQQQQHKKYNKTGMHESTAQLIEMHESTA